MLYSRSSGIVFFLFCVIFAFPVYSAIDLSVDVTGTDQTASTASDRVYVERIELSFPNNRASQTVPLMAKGLYAKARFKYLGNGPLTIRWTVDGRVISQSTQILTFGKEVEIRSDKTNVALPTFQRGSHTVSLQLRNSQGLIDVSVPAIRYFVADGAPGLLGDGALQLIYPAKHTVDASQLAFRWQGQKLFKAYALEVQRIASKTVDSKTVIKAITDVDAYAPSDSQRKELKAADYRWRVKAFYADKKVTPVSSDWSEFSIAESAGGIFIRDISSRTDAQAATPSLQFSNSDIAPEARMVGPQKFKGSGAVSAGQPYQLTVDIQNTGRMPANDLLLEVRDGSKLIGRFPVQAQDGKNTRLSIPLLAENADRIQYSSISVNLLDSSRLIDSGEINLAIAPELRLDGLDFAEVDTSFSASVAIDNPCGSTSPSHDLVFSRMVSASRQQGNTTQSLTQQGHFTFVKGESIRFTAFLKDKGLGDWFANTRTGCNQQPLSEFDRNALQSELETITTVLQQCFAQHAGDKPESHCRQQLTAARDVSARLEQDDIFAGRTFRLRFIAHPVDQFGQTNGAPIEIGEVNIDRDYEGMVDSAFWTIPDSGQYRITLNDISEPADLYATNAGGMPKYIHAGGFVLQLDQVNNDSNIISLNPRQAVISGTAHTRWSGDSSDQAINLVLNSVAVDMRSNPLHGELTGGVIELNDSGPVNLNILGAALTLSRLQLDVTGAKADLSYQMPGDYQGNSMANAPIASSTGVGRISARLVEPVSAINDGRVKFKDLDIFNGGEFVARYDFDNEWNDIRINQENLALRLKGSSLVVDASPHFSFTDYTSENEFVGFGFHHAIVRVKVNGSNRLFNVANSDAAFIYGRADWLDYSAQQLSGEEIEVLPGNSVAAFFDQSVAASFDLLQPFGFKLAINGGVFSLDNSRVGGVDFAGQVSLPQNSNTTVLSSHELAFQHLHRRQSATGMSLFVTESINDSSIKFSIGVFDYQPQTLRLFIGEETQPGVHSFPNPVFDQLQFMEHEVLGNWQEALTQTLTERAGLLLGNGDLDKSWTMTTGPGDTLEGTHRGAFLINGEGLTGQWIDAGDSRYYRVDGFSSKIVANWLKFENSVLVDSYVQGQLQVPYPVGQAFSFRGQLNQHAGLHIAENALQMPDQDVWDLAYWKARLHVPASLLSVNAPTINSQLTMRGRGQTSEGPGAQSPQLIFDQENQRIKIQGLGLSLLVSEDHGGEEFVARDGGIPFTIDTYIMPDGQLAETRVTSRSEILFVGQTFQPDDEQAIHFLPYFGDHQPPADDETETSLPLVEVRGEVGFSVFGPRNVTIHHTALGARVPDISRAPEVDEYYGEGNEIRVNAQLQFVNTYGRSAEGVVNQVSQSTGESAGDVQPFKAFVGSAELVIMNAVSIKGLAEAGLHPRSELTRTAENQGVFVNIPGGEKVGYERLGLGVGADIVKATLAGVRGMETATRLGGAAVSATTGVDGTGEQVVELGTDAVSFLESVAVASAVTVGSQGAAGAEEIRHAIDNGLSTTDSALQLLKTICEQQADCLSDTALQLDIASLLVRLSGGVTHFDELSPDEIASIGIQAMDTGIPLLRGIPLEQATAQWVNVPVADMKDASLAAAHTVVGAARSLVDNDGRIAFADFLNVSRRAVSVAEAMGQVSNEVSSEDAKKLLDLSVALANESIIQAEAFHQSGGVDAQKLSGLANQTIKLMCGQSENVQPLFRAAGFPQASDEFIKPVMSFSSRVLEKIETDGLSQNAQQAGATFLINLLNTLAEPTSSVEGCDVSSMQALPAVQAMLKIAAHSIEPMKGSLTDEGKQIAWALTGVSLSIDAIDRISQQSNGTQFNQAAQIKQVLQSLSSTFSDLQSGLSDNQNNANGQTVLRLAKGIPEAFQQLIASGSAQAAQLMDVYIALMREAEILMGNADQLAAGNLDGVDLFALPLALIEETQDLSLLNQCQKFGLANIANVIGMSRELASSEPVFGNLFDRSQTIYNNIKACDSSGLMQSPELEKLMALLSLTASVADNNRDQIQARINAELPRLLPILVSSSTDMLASIRAFTLALPIIDFTQDDLGPVLDATLIRLLNEAESSTANAETKRAIAKARSIISYADFDLIGVTFITDEGGNIIGVKHVRADGSWREFNFEVGAATQFYPENHPDQLGGLSDLYFSVPIQKSDFDTLAEADKNNLFTSYWDGLLSDSQLKRRHYKDESANHVYLDETEGYAAFVIESAQRHGNYSPRYAGILTDMPRQLLSATQLQQSFVEHYLVANFYVPPEQDSCPFKGSGCMAMYARQQGFMTMLSTARADYKVNYIYQEAETGFESFDAILQSIQGVFSFKGRIVSTEHNWNPAWEVSFTTGADNLSIRKGNSIELISTDGFDAVIDDFSKLAEEIMAQDTFILRRVVNGNDVWEYLSLNQRAVHQFGNGSWELYSMPDSLPQGTAVPAPDQVIDLSVLTLQLAGNDQGVQEDPLGMASQLTSAEGGIEIPADDSAQIIRINFNSSDAVIVGGVPSQTTSTLVEAGVDSEDVESIETQGSASNYPEHSPIQSTLVNTDAGEQVQVTASDDDRLKITRRSQLQSRITNIEFCFDETKTIASCPANTKQVKNFSYQWQQGVGSEISYLDFDFSNRPAVSPASGANQSLKHQLWLTLFNLEADLFANPSEAGLDQLDALIQQGKNLAMPYAELDAQKKFVTARVLNSLLANAFERYEAQAADPRQIYYWRENPSASPLTDINRLIDRADRSGIDINSDIYVWQEEIAASEYFIDHMELQRIARDPDGGSVPLMATLRKLLVRVMRIEAIKMYQGEQSSVNEAICPYFEPVSSYLDQSMRNHVNFVPTASDIRTLMEFEAARVSMGCAGASMSEIVDLAENLYSLGDTGTATETGHGTQLDNLIRAIREPTYKQLFYQFGDADKDNYSTNDVISFFVKRLMLQEVADPVAGNLAQITPPSVQQLDDWIDLVFILDRVETEIINEKNRREADSRVVYFYPGLPNARYLAPLREALLDKLKAALVTEHQRLVEDFTGPGESADMEKIDALILFNEKMKAINQRIQSKRQPLVAFDSYLDVTGSGQQLFSSISNQQTSWLNELWLQQDQNRLLALRDKLLLQDEVILYLQSMLPVSQQTGLPAYSSSYFKPKLDETMIAVRDDFAGERAEGDDVDSAINRLAATLVQTDSFLKHMQLDDLYADFQQQLQALVDQALDRVKLAPDTVQLEINKIVAIRSVLSGELAADNTDALSADVDTALSNAIDALLAELNSTGNLAILSRLISAIATHQQMFPNGDWEISEIADALEPIREQMANELVTSKDLDKVPSYIRLLATMSGLGIEVDMSDESVIEVYRHHRNILLQCETNNSCTVTHVRLILEYDAMLQAMGYSDDVGMAEAIELLDEEQSVIMIQSLRFDREMPDVQKLVYEDKTGHRGRLAAAITLERLGNSLKVNRPDGRLAIKSVIRRLKSLASMQLPAGSSKPAPDPLLTSADNLQQRIDIEMERLTDQLEAAIEDITLAPEAVTQLAADIGVSEEELTDDLLPEINGSNTLSQRIEPGNKYRLAAAELAGLAELQNSPYLNLSYRILNNIPDPAITAEGDYRLAGIGQLVSFMFVQSGDLVANAIDHVDEDRLQQIPAAAVVLTLLSLPAEQQPVQALAQTIETQMLSPLINGDNAAMNCSQGAAQCLMSGGLQMLALSLDSLIPVVQQAANDGTPDPAQLARQYLKQLANNLSALDSSAAPENFWMALAGDGLGVSLNVVAQSSNLEKQLALDSLVVANRLMSHPPLQQFVGNLNQPVPMAFYFVRDASVFLTQHLQGNQDQHLPIALARLAQGAVIDSISHVDSRLAGLGNELMDWQLDFADANWALITDAAAGNVNADSWLSALNTGTGIASLNCRVNQQFDLDIPPALTMMPFVAGQRLLAQQNQLRDNQQAASVITNIAADLSNLWFAPINDSQCDAVQLADLSVDEPVAKLLRPLSQIDLNAGADLASVQLVGNFGIGAINILLPNTALSNVMSLVWNGADSGTGVDDFIVLGMQGGSVDPQLILSKAEGVSVTAAEIVETLTAANDPTALMMRVLAGQVKQSDLVAPDRLLGASRAYALPNSILATLGQVRKVIKPLAAPNLYFSDPNWGYLKTVPFIDWNNGAPQLSAADDYAGDMNDMIAMARNFNVVGAANQGAEAVQKVMVAGTDIARLGINGIAPLIDPDPTHQQAVAQIQQRALFDTLAGDTPGFSGVSGGLQREWPVTSGPSAANDLILEMYGQLVFPALGRHVGMMQLIDQGEASVLEFNSATATEAVGEFVGGVTGGIQAQFSVDGNGALAMVYQGNTKLQILSNTIAEGAASGFVGDFHVPNGDGLNPLQYATRQAENIDIMQCASLETQVIPFPLSLTGIGATSTVGGFMEKSDLGLIYGSRVGLSGNMKFPVINSLLGITLDGDITSANGGSINPATGQIELTNQSCVNPDIQLTVLGQTFSLTGVDAKVASFIEGNIGQQNVNSGIKMQVSLNSQVISAIKTELGCASFNPIQFVAAIGQNPSEALVNQTLCTALGGLSESSVWVVLRNQMNPAQAQMIFGLGQFPAQGSSSMPFFKGSFNVNNNTLAPVGSIEITDQVGAWGGWPGSQNINLCNKQLCDVSQFEQLQ